MRISDWSSDVSSSDLQNGRFRQPPGGAERPGPGTSCPGRGRDQARPAGASSRQPPALRRDRHGKDRKSVVSGKSVSVRVDIGGRRIIKQKITTDHHKLISRQNNITQATYNTST